MITLDDIMTMARTVYGEARGEDIKSMRAVVHVILNRVKRGGRDHTPAAACLRRYQFSCWNENDPNRHKIRSIDMSNSLFRKCFMCVMIALYDDENGVDITHGATHYHNANMDEYPYWAKGRTPLVSIGPFHFYDVL